MTKRVAIILAAGVSSRMNTRIRKVLHEVCGRPMLSYVVDACREAGVEKMYIVVGFGAEQVQEKFSHSVKPMALFAFLIGLQGIVKFSSNNIHSALANHG